MPFNRRKLNSDVTPSIDKDRYNWIGKKTPYIYML